MKRVISIVFAGALLCRLAGSAAAAPVYQQVPELSDAKEYIIKAFAEGKLVFIGEDRSHVNDELFMAGHMRDFYDAGLRYVFREGRFADYAPVSSGAEAEAVSAQTPLLFPPWRTDVGGKYEEGALEEAVRRINDAVSEEERIWFIASETGYAPDRAEDADPNVRDQRAFEHIEAFMEQTPADKKLLIFYRDAYGINQTALWSSEGSEPLIWTPLGARLKERYGDRFVSIALRSAQDELYGLSWAIPELREPEAGPKIAFSESVHTIMGDELMQHFLSSYDAVILDREAVYGTGFAYYPSYDHLLALYRRVRDLEDQVDAWKDSRSPSRFAEPGQYVQLIYYLKLWLGDSFDYRFWDTSRPAAVVLRMADTKKPLREVLNSLDEQSIAAAARYLNADDPQNLQRMRDYTKTMLLSSIHQLVYEAFDPAVPLPLSVERREALFSWIAGRMRESSALFPQDLWPYYWLAYAETELGDYSAAIEHWEYIISQPLAACFEPLPRVYEKLSACYAAAGDQEQSEAYKKTGESLLNEHNLFISSVNDVK
jgi:hypothetical protein